MSFISGFAEGFTAQYNRRKDREEQEQDMMFKYKMDELMKNKELRTKKKYQESEWTNQAKNLSGQLGDSESASMFYNELKNGVSYEALQKRILENQYQKNDNYKQPTQTVRLPAGVREEETTTAPDMYGQAPTPTGNPLKDVIASGKHNRQSRNEQKVNEKIDQIDPTLRQTPIGVGDEGKTMDYSNSPYVLKKTNEYKIGDYADARYELLKAEQSGDPQKIRDARDKVLTHQKVMSEKAILDAQANGKNAGRYFLLNDDGTINSLVTGEIRTNPETNSRELWNITDPREEAPIQGNVRALDDKGFERYNKITDDFSRKAADYNASASSFIAAMDSSRKIEALVVNNPDITRRYTASGVKLLNDLSGDAQAAYGTLLDMENQINTQVQSGDLEGIEAKVNEYTKKANEFVSDTLLSPKMNKLALDKAKYDSLRISAAYQFAVASGVASGRMSNQDFENNYQRLGGDSGPREILAGLQLTGQEAFVRLDSVRNVLKNEPQITQFERDYGIKTGLAPGRLGDQIMELDIPDEEKAQMMKYLSNIQNKNAVGKAIAGQDASVQQSESGPAIPQGAIDMLVKNPSLKAKFDEKYGPGASDRYLRSK